MRPRAASVIFQRAMRAGELAGITENIRKAVENDKFVGHRRPFIVEQNATWLKATTASPVITGRAIYCAEGYLSKKRILVGAILVKAERSWKARGNSSPCLLPREQATPRLRSMCVGGDLSQRL